MKPKHILLASILAGLLAVVLAHVQLRTERGETFVLLRATETVEPGEPLGNRIEEVTFPGRELFPNLLEEAVTSQFRELAATAPLRDTVHAGQIILYRHLESAADAGLRSQIPPGKKAIAIEVDGAAAVAYLVEPGDRVDVLATVPSTEAGSNMAPAFAEDLGALPDGFPGAAGFDPADLDAFVGPPSASTLVTRRLLENVEVAAVGPRYRRAAPSEVGQPFDTVTLLVDDAQARNVAQARDAQGGTMTLVLRRETDTSRGTSEGSSEIR